MERRGPRTNIRGHLAFWGKRREFEMKMDRKFGRIPSFALALGLVISASTVLVGCSEENNRQPTAAEGKAADDKRQAYIDTLNLPADQKARMKAQMGGPAVPNPADAAKSAGGKAAGGR